MLNKFSLTLLFLAPVWAFSQSKDSATVYDFKFRIYDPRINCTRCPWLTDSTYKPPKFHNNPYKFAEKKPLFINADSIPDEWLELLPDSLKKKVLKKKMPLL